MTRSSETSSIERKQEHESSAFDYYVRTGASSQKFFDRKDHRGIQAMKLVRNFLDRAGRLHLSILCYAETCSCYELTAEIALRGSRVELRLVRTQASPSE